jgi:hypothetical protein
MFLLIEIDKQFSLGIDWYKYSKGFRLGFIAIHICTASFSRFIDVCTMDKMEEAKEQNSGHSIELYQFDEKVFYVQRGDGTKYKYDGYRVQWYKKIDGRIEA